MTQQISANYIVAYGFNDKFYISEAEAKALVSAAESGKRLVKFSNRIFSTSFSWVVPVEEVEAERLSLDELKTARKVAGWLTRPVHNLDFTAQSAEKYAKKIVKKLGSGSVEEIFETHANGSYPSARGFMVAIKEQGTDSIIAPLLEESSE